MLHPIRALALAVLAPLLLWSLAAGSAQAGALVYGTAAWTNTALTLREGPGPAYDVVGDMAGEIKIRVERCTKRWCLIRGEASVGWVSIDHLSFGEGPGYLFDGPKLNYPSGGPGIVCFYSGQHYSGAAVCAETGAVVHDLLLYGLDDRFSSVSIEGNVSVNLCRDMNFSSYCERVIESKPVLSRYLLRSVSSYRVY
jgi:uncharacterized protein YraI